MNRRKLTIAAAAICAFPALGAPAASNAPIAPAAQTVKPVPRPAPRDPNAPMIPAKRSVEWDGYAPTPQWPGQTHAPRPAKSAAFDVETVAQGFTRAFSFNFLPDGRMIVAERGGAIKIAGLDGKVSEVQGPPNLYTNPGQGMYEVRPDRDFATNRQVYLTYTTVPANAPQWQGGGIAIVASATLSADDKQLENVRVLMSTEGMDARVIQASDGTLMVTSTVVSAVQLNARDWPQSQQLDSNMGKVLRINTDGTVPADNPFVGRKGAHPEIYALGFRDIQGVVIHPRTGKLWTSEHGPRGGDEINAVEKGKNYGFPVIGYGHEYDGTPINNDKTFQEGMEQPVYFWTPDIAPAGIAFYTGRLFPEWQGDLFVAALANHSLVRLVLKGERVIGEERLLSELNSRVRGVNQGPDGALYVLIDGASKIFPQGATGKILRLVPKR